MAVTRNHTAAFCLGGAATAALFLGLGANTPPAPPAPAAAPRFLLTNPWVSPRTDVNTPTHGTYRIDTQTGDVLEIVDNSCHKVE